MNASADARPTFMTLGEAGPLSDSLFVRASGANGASAISLAVEASSGVTDAQACAAMVELHAFIDAEPPADRARDARALLIVLMSPE